ncbi:hypothetical protein [Absidia glauca]|uniref:CSD domain-containing protein n=1 Tax=Absidia glauca TaxID=4829 RepID=A0A168N2K6_ABSGL|nr:hypothetical protein [Absidia glauca]
MSAKEARKTGRVKFFNDQKGYGFIIPDDSAGQNDVEVFVHYTALCNNGNFKNLSQDEEVEYDLVQVNKGMQAANVTGIGGAPLLCDLRVMYPTSQSGGERIPYNSGYPHDPYASGGGYGYSSGGAGVFIPYAGNAAGGNQIPPQNFQYGQPTSMYNGGGGQQQYGYQQQPPYGMHSQQRHQQ